MDQPQVTVDEKLLRLCSEISLLLGRYEGLSGARPQPKLRRSTRIRTLQGSLAIEGNSLSIDQITALLDGKRVAAPKKDLLEARNANSAYERVPDLNPYQVTDMLKAHGILMAGLVPDAGRWRAGAVGIVKGSVVSHLAPRAHFVQGLIKDLMKWARASRGHPLIVSSVFHHQFELIHPFSDGNGRMGRLWQHLMLNRFHPAFEFIPVESVVRERQGDYYAALEAADRAGESTAFVVFMLEAILKSTEDLLGAMRPVRATGAERLQDARAHFGHGWFSRKDYIARQPALSAPTASRDLKLGVDEKQLERKGAQALARYRFKS